MQVFNYKFTVNASKEIVAAFHHDTTVLKKLTPPPIFIQIHNFEPLADNSVAQFTLWFGPIPIHWKAIHSNVDDSGFTDTQARGPLKRWRHTHRFRELETKVTLVSEHIEYEYEPGLRGLPGRLLFSKPALYLLFTARKVITRRQIKKRQIFHEQNRSDFKKVGETE